MSRIAAIPCRFVGHNYRLIDCSAHFDLLRCDRCSGQFLKPKPSGFGGAVLAVGPPAMVLEKAEASWCEFRSKMAEIMVSTMDKKHTVR